MNRRSFLGELLKAGAACAILPAATTYVRHWSGILVPPRPVHWVRAHYTIGGPGQTKLELSDDQGRRFASMQELTQFAIEQRASSPDWMMAITVQTEGREPWQITYPDDE